MQDAETIAHTHLSTGHRSTFQVDCLPMLSIDRVLTLVDPSSMTPQALDQALVLADRCTASVHVLPFPNGTALAGAHATRLQRLVDDRSEYLGVTPTVEVPSAPCASRSSPASVLLDYSRDHNMGLIVADTPADRGPIPALASSPVRALAEQADVPLFIVARYSDAADFRRVLVPTDFSDHAQSALEHAKELADLYGAELDVLHIMERPKYVALNTTDMLALNDATLPERTAQRRLDTLIDAAGGPDVPVRTHCRHGDAADQICRFTDEHPIDLVVLSTHGTISRRHHPLGNVADKVLRRVTTPVFLTRAFGRSLVSATPSV